MTEKQDYEVVRTYADFELRRYPSHVVAEVVVQASFEDAGATAFRALFGYISGQNREAGKIAMTSPVVQSEPRRVGTTDTVEQRETSSGEHAVAFVLPSSYTLESAPVPTSPEVQLHERPTVLSAARRYRGGWTRAAFEDHRRELDRAVGAAGLVPVGQVRWARFDPPLVPWFLRRNEVVQDVQDPGAAA